MDIETGRKILECLGAVAAGGRLVCDLPALVGNEYEYLGPMSPETAREVELRKQAHGEAIKAVKLTLALIAAIQETSRLYLAATAPEEMEDLKIRQEFSDCSGPEQ